MVLNSRRNYRNQEPHQVIIRLVGISVVILIALWHLFFPKHFASVVTYWASGVWEAADALEENRPFTSREDLIVENQRLQKEIVRLFAIASSSEAVYLQNHDLRNALGRIDNTSTISAEVLARPPYTLYDTLVIDRGMSHGLRNGMTAFSLGTSTPLGYILHADANTSIVKLYSSPGEESDVLIGGNNLGSTSKARLAFRAKGMGGGMFQVIASHEAGVEVGDIVTKPSTFSGYFGRVSAIEIDPNSTFAHIYFNLPENPRNIRWVEILP